MLQRAVERTPDESVLLRERVQQQTAKQIEDEQDRVQQRFAERKICSAPGDQILDVPTILTEEHLVKVPGSVFEEKNLAPLTCR